MKYTPLYKINLFFNIYGRMFAAIFRLRTWSGFFILALFQIAGLYALARFYLPVLYQILYPILSGFVPQRMFHYPQFYLTLPSVYSGFDNFVLGPTVWVLFSAFAIYRLEAYYLGEKRKFKDGLKKALGAYFPLLMFWALETGLVLVAIAFPSSILSGFVEGSPRRQIALSLGLQMCAFVISAFLIYTIPGVILGGQGLGTAIKNSIILCWRNFFLTYFIIMIPGAIKTVLDLALTGFSPRIIGLLNPEMIVAFLAAEIILGIFLNLFIYGTAVFVYKEMS